MQTDNLTSIQHFGTYLTNSNSYFTQINRKYGLLYKLLQHDISGIRNTLPVVLV